ncbi:MAG TPA: ABC transporter permease [Flavilitoribacter sp.]|nr:ABC transporter permease [Flavilitoribacter sp.]
MFKNFLLVAVRNLFKHRTYSLVNILGLALGLTFCFLMFIYIQFEYSYDRFNSNLDRLYRVNYGVGFSGSTFEVTRIPSPFGPLLKDFFPEVETAARFFPRSISVRIPSNNQSFEMPNAMFADSTATRVFDFDFIQGNPEEALKSPFSIVLTDETARQFFGDEDPIGRGIMLANGGPVNVTGVIRAMPENSHFDFDFLARFENMVDAEPDFARASLLDVLRENRLASHSYTYVLLKPGASAEAVNARFKDFLLQHGDERFRDKQSFSIFPVRDIHLKSTAEGEPVPVANPSFMRIFMAIGLLVLLIACINFVNLSTAVYLGRTKEVGIRKVLGSGRRGLIRQFLGETLLLGTIAFVLAMIVVGLLLPKLDLFFGRSIPFSFLQHPGTIALFIGVFLTASLLAGSYPAFFASRFRPVSIFQGKALSKPGKKNWLSKSLITLQFIVAVALITGTGVILRQINFLQNRPLGFNKDMILDIPLYSSNMNSHFAPGDQKMRNKTNAFEEKLLQNPDILASTLASNLPGLGNSRNPIVTDKFKLEDNLFLPCVSVDYDYAETFGLNMVAGRDFDISYGTDHLDAYIINEFAVKTLGWNSPEEALGQRLSKGGREGKIIGVIQDYHTQSLRYDLESLVLEVRPGAFTDFAVRLSDKNVPQTIEYIRKTWEEFFPEKVFESRFLDESLDSAYQEESRFGRIITIFAGMAIFLACFGLFGLISFTVKNRNKEIGVRKVLGASVAGIVGLLSRDFILLVMIALLVASPVAWFFMSRWLDGFAYHIPKTVGAFAPIAIGAGIGAVLIAFLTLSVQSVRAALMNPVDSLRDE